jgi:ACR3 family arsenite efflux pump ArsB
MNVFNLFASHIKLPKAARPYAISIAAGLAYGLFLRLWLYASPGVTRSAVSHITVETGMLVMSAGYLLICPFVIGWLSIPRPARDTRSHWLEWIFLPWIAILLGNLWVFLWGK